MVDYDIPAELVDQAVPDHPGHRVADRLAAGRSALVGGARDGVPRETRNRVMDELYELGARGIIVTDIHACRL